MLERVLDPSRDPGRIRHGSAAPVGR
jgi:hypothetical protein